MDTLALSLVLAGKFLLRNLKYKIDFLFFVDALYQVKEAPLYSYFGVFFYHEWVLDFVKFLLHLLILLCIFFFFSQSIGKIDYIN